MTVFDAITNGQTEMISMFKDTTKLDEQRLALEQKHVELQAERLSWEKLQGDLLAERLKNEAKSRSISDLKVQIDTAQNSLVAEMNNVKMYHDMGMDTEKKEV